MTVPEVEPPNASSVDEGARFRIGELGKRCGVSTHALRAWEARYGLLQPMRTTSGYRLYGPADERRVREVIALREQGIPMGEAVDRVLRADRGSPTPASQAGVLGPTDFVRQLRSTMESFDEVGAQSVVDSLSSSLSLELMIRDVLMPFLQDMGDRWERSEISVAHEHFATHLIRRRLSPLTLTWGTGTGPIAVLACPPGEQHDLALMCFGLLLSRAGWRIRYLGQDMPMTSIDLATHATKADLVVLAATRTRLFLARAQEIQDLAGHVVVALGGKGADAELAAKLGAHALPLDLLEAVSVARELVPSDSAAIG